MSNETLGILLFFIVAFAWTVYVVQELFITGASSLNMSISKNEGERKQIQVASGIHFDGIEVWLVGAIALLFGSFPLAFATIFTYLYVPFFLLLYAIIGRGISIEMMYKLDSERWVKSMKTMWTVSSILIMFILGVYLSNIFYGFPLDANGMTESFISIFNVTGIAGGVFFVALSLVAGAGWISLTTSGPIGEKAVAFVKKVGVIYAVPVLLLLVFMGFNNTDASIFIGELFTASPILFVLPALAVIFAIATMYKGFKQHGKHMFIFALLTMGFFLITGFVGMFPYLVPSNLIIESGITLQDAMARTESLRVIFIAVCIFFPVIVGYQTWKYIRFTERVNFNDE